MTEPSENPASFKRRTLGKHLLQALLGMIVLELLLATSEYLALQNLSPGTAYVLTPRGMGRAKDFLQMGLIVSGAAVFFTFPALCVRPALGCLLRALMFVVFTGTIVGINADHPVAVVETPTDFQFVYRYPFATSHLPFKEFYVLRGWPQDRSLNIETLNRRIHLPYVHVNDPQTSAVMEELFVRLCRHAAQPAP